MTKDKFDSISDRDVIILKATAKNAKHTVQPAFDPKVNWYAGVPRLSEDDKKKLDFWVDKNSKLTLVDNITFDLSNSIDKANWEWVRHCRAVAASVEDLLQSPEAMFYVHIEDREAREKNKKSEIAYKAQKFIMEDSTDNYSGRCLLLGMDMEDQSTELMKEFLLERAKTDAEEIIRIYSSKNLAIQLLFLTAKKQGKIIEANGVLRYGTSILGVSEEASIAFLQEPDNKELVKLMERDVNPQYFGDMKTSKTESESTEETESEEPKKNYNFKKK